MCRYVGMWVCGCVGVWVFGCVGVLSTGYWLLGIETEDKEVER